VFPGLPAAAAWAALARPRRSPQVSTAARTMQVLTVTAILACPVLALREMALYPGNGGPSSFAGLVVVVVFAAEPAGYLLLILRRPGPLGSGRRGGLAGLAAVVITGAVVLRSHPPAGTVLLMTVAVPAAVGVLAGIVARDWRAGSGQWLSGGISDMLWGWLLTPPAWFIADMLATTPGAVAAEARLPATIQQAHQQGATSITAWVGQDDLGAGIFVFTVLAVSVMVAMLIGYVIITCNFSKHGEDGDDPAAIAR
jgi:hypothetical protein